jgi:N-acetylmuramoyl-L-alanine amidase
MTNRNGSVVIDAGHGGSSRAGNSSAYGVRGPTGALEKDLMLQLANRVAAHYGPGATLTRNADVNLPLGERTAVAQRLGSRVFISLHANSGPPGARGAEAYVHERSSYESMALAESVQRELGAYGHATAPTGREALAVLSPDRLPPQTAACLLEVDYLSDPYGEQRLTDPASMDRLGAAIARGIQRYMGAQPAFTEGQNLAVIVGITEVAVGVFEVAQGLRSLVSGGLNFQTNKTNVTHPPRPRRRPNPWQDRETPILTVNCTAGTLSSARCDFILRWRANGNDIEDCYVEKTNDSGWSASRLDITFEGREASSYEAGGVGCIMMYIRGMPLDPAGGGDIDFEARVLVKGNGTIQNIGSVNVVRGNRDDFTFGTLPDGGFSITQNP